MKQWGKQVYNHCGHFVLFLQVTQTSDARTRTKHDGAKRPFADDQTETTEKVC